MLRVLPLLLLGFVFFGCAAEARPIVVNDGQAADFVPQEPANPVAAAEELLGGQFTRTGWINSIVKITANDGVLKVTLDRDTTTLAGFEAYVHMCEALTPLIGSDTLAARIRAIQFFAADGRSILSGNKPESTCHPF